MLEIAEHFISDHGGLGAFTALLVLKIGEIIWHYFQSRDSKLNDLKCALERNTITMLAIQKDLRTFKTDLRRAFFALKKVSGDDWPEIAEEIEERFKHDDEQPRG